MRTRWFAVSVVLASLALAAPLAGLAAGTGPSAAKVTSVKVTAGKPTEFHFTLSKSAVAKGTVTFTVTNSGKLEHDFKIDGRTSRKVQPGKSTTLRVVLNAGKFKYLCTVPGHAAAGMRGTLTVK
jgi:uncharacterized cupredoxin-like copper-binding protein